MSRVFVCSPFRGEVKKNKAVARKLCRELALAGDTPIAPHLFFPQFLDDVDSGERDIGISAGIDMLLLCDRMLVFTSNGISEGMEIEIKMAQSAGVPVEYMGDVQIG